ncbi:MAG TPA: WYL domain-containing protein [Gemmatimonadaceae bacterium]|nr:WYL domain-containing protein [Gemmatimonadaceae bacterium]
MPARKRSSPAAKKSRARSPSSTQPKIQRWIDLVAALLRRHYGVSFEELRQEVPAYAEDKSKATILRMFERDKDDLRELGVPIETVYDDDGQPAAYRLRVRDFYLPYLAATTEREGYRALPRLAFEPEELAAVADAAERVRQLEDPVLAADADAAIRKLAFDLPVGSLAANGIVRIVPGTPRASDRTFELLDSALRRRKRVSFDYHSMERDESNRRSVEPYGLFFLGAHWYLAARDAERGVLRNFRISRIANVEVNEHREQSADYDIPRDFDLRAHAVSRHAWELGDGDALDAVVRFRSLDGATAAAARLGEPVDGDDGTRRFRVRRTGTFARWLMSFAGDARPLSPPEVVEAYRECSRRTLARYESSPSSGGTARGGRAG